MWTCLNQTVYTQHTHTHAFFWVRVRTCAYLYVCVCVCVSVVSMCVCVFVCHSHGSVYKAYGRLRALMLLLLVLLILLLCGCCVVWCYSCVVLSATVLLRTCVEPGGHVSQNACDTHTTHTHMHIDIYAA